MTTNEPAALGPTPPSSSPDPTTPGPYVWARWVNVVLGAWLFISAVIWWPPGAAFIWWPPGSSAAPNSWLVGLVIVAVSLIAMYVSWVRWLNTALAVWLFVSTLAFTDMSSGAAWNNEIIALLVFLMSLLPDGVYAPPRPPPPPPTG
jgi:hypothetical protein